MRISAVIVGLTLVAIPASAATITVGTTADVVATDGECSLREAVLNANLSGGGDLSGGDCAVGSAGADTIELPAGIYLRSNTPPEGDFDIEDDLTIVGSATADTVIDTLGFDRAFDVFAPQGPVSFELRDLTLRGAGYVLGGLIGGAIRAEASTTVQILDCVIEGFIAEQESGLTSRGTLVVRRSVIRDSWTLKGSSAIGIYSGNLVLTDTVIDSNRSISGEGAIYVSRSTAAIERCSITRNEMAGLRIGGASSDVTVTNSTLSGSPVGISQRFGTLALNFVTITDHAWYGLQISGVSPTSSRNTIVAGNTLFDCLFQQDGVLDSLGYNLDSDSTCFGAGPGDLAGASPNLGPLQFNGGSTETHALLAPSPAIDSADPACADAQGSPISEDQRESLRPLDGDGDSLALCDRGAYEASVPGAPPAVPDGSIGSPLTASLIDAGGSTIEVQWDVTLCAAQAYHLIYGPLANVASYDLSGAECGLPANGTLIWSPVPADSLYFLMVADDGLTTEGTWGEAGGGPRNGVTPSLQCGMIARSNSTTCP